MEINEFNKAKIPFSLSEYEERWHRVRLMMSEERIDLLFVTGPEGICYLHGHQANWYQGNSPKEWPAISGTAIHVNHDSPIHFDIIDEINLLRQSSILKDIRIYPTLSIDSIFFLIGELSALGWLGGTVGLEFSNYRPNRSISETMEQAFIAAGNRVVDSSSIMRKVRRIKSPQEIAMIEQAYRIVDIGHHALQKNLRPGVTELDLAAEVNYAMMKAGGEQAALLLSLQSGPLASFHGLPSRRIISQGDLVTMDPCGVVNRYHANRARAYYLGDPDKKLISLYEAAGGAFNVLVDNAKNCTSVSHVNRILRTYYEDSNIWPLREWVGGYELGISFPPDWVGDFVFTVEDENSEDYFQAGMVTNFESIFGTFLIDTVVYEEKQARILSADMPQLMVID
ncbi:MAG: aminopeptidase P family protein [Alphaproteobacteria bacterium]|nr:aminopeptidase P family protein [Alphaproteobacteria bacterium]